MDKEDTPTEGDSDILIIADYPLFPGPEKYCPMCKEVFPATNEFFYVSLTKRNGLHNYCRGCNIKRQRDWYKKNREYAIGDRADYHKHQRK